MRKVTPLYLVKPSKRSDDVPVVELGSENLVSLPDDTEVRINRLIAEELRPRRPARGERTVATARRPALPTWWRRPSIVAAIAFALVWNVLIGAYCAFEASNRTAAAPAIPAPRVVPPPPPPVRCEVTSSSRVLARSVLVRGGVEAAAWDDRLGLGVVKGPSEGIAFELDRASLAVKSATKVVAATTLQRVLPEVYADAPFDAIAEVGAAHVVAGGDGDAYELASQGGFVVWRPHDAGDGRPVARLWPTAADVEAPRVARSRADRVVVFRREGAIWMGTLRVDREGAHAGALTQVSPPAAQVGAPSIDARDEDVVIAWAQRDATASGWGVRWARWRHGARVGAVHVIPAAAGASAIAPSVAVLERGDVLVAWTEGDATHHRVRAQPFARDDRPASAPIDVSPEGIDAGQAQLAIGDGGRGALGYLVARGRAFDLAASAIACR